ncbi:hypothetical protein HPP92_027612 [Vanilla planifolia]|uniref:DUF1677 family protein n=1 Tax=Vanilla planifolia TaxID=51239 RepID=A0A835U448_VANPL|nr:hypothetical protein HPP92_027612 [Vanilla planifolia]KAG0448966.1 hypothetical protein HPP92_027608 [Vanilla planifolia]
MSISPTEGTAAAVDLNFAECECCGLGEECTPAYIDRVRERHHGSWICGLCSEAVQDEIHRAEYRISIEEAIDRHMRFSRKLHLAAEKPEESAELLIAALRQLMRRGLESPRSQGSTPASPRWRTEDEVSDGIGKPSSLTTSGSCFPAVAG